MKKKDVFDILDYALFYDGREVETDLMRHLYRLKENGEIKKEPREVLEEWVEKRKYKIYKVEIIKT